MAAKQPQKVEENALLQFKTDDLVAELERRKALRIKEEGDKRAKTWWLLSVILRHSFSVTTPEGVIPLAPALLNILAPTHHRTTCSDDEPINGWYSEAQDSPLCTRCALIELRNIYDSGPVDCVPKLEISFSPVK